VNFSGDQCWEQGGEPCAGACAVAPGSILELQAGEEFFALRDGESFVLSGEVNSYDDASCGGPPRCHFTFFETHDYATLRDGIQVVTFEGQVTGGPPAPDGSLEACEFRVVAAITVGTRPPIDSDSDGLTDEEERLGWSSFASPQDLPACGICVRGPTPGATCTSDLDCLAPKALEEGACQREAGFVRYTSNPFEPDTDFDLVPDWLELRLGTNPRNPDTDCDGLVDLEEIGVGAWIAENPTECPGYRQLERDEVEAIRGDCDEYFNCWYIAGTADSSPTVWDTDCDGTFDGRKVGDIVIGDVEQEQVLDIYPEWLFTGSSSCPYVWKRNPINLHYYTFSSRGTWEEAEQEAIGLGGHLVTIRNQEENDWLVENFVLREEALCSGVPRAGPWIGLTDWDGPVYGPTGSPCSGGLECAPGQICVLEPCGAAGSDPNHCGCVHHTREGSFGWASGEFCAVERTSQTCHPGFEPCVNDWTCLAECVDGEWVRNLRTCTVPQLTGHRTNPDRYDGYDDLAHGEPNNYGNEDFFHFWDRSLRDEWHWNDFRSNVTCGSSLPGIIEVEALPEFEPGPFQFAARVALGGEEQTLMESGDLCPALCTGETPCEAAGGEGYDAACHHCSIAPGTNLRFPREDPLQPGGEPGWLRVTKEFKDDLTLTVELSGWGIDATGAPQSCAEATSVQSVGTLKGKLGFYTPLLFPDSLWSFADGVDGTEGRCEDCCLVDDAFIFGVQVVSPLP
jgi:hypothetical protein